MPTWSMAFPDSPLLSALLLVVALVIVMYGARSSAHRVIQATAKAVTQACKLTADAIKGGRPGVDPVVYLKMKR